MANNLVIRALKANSKSFNMSSKKMTEVPKSVARLTHILTLYLNNNSLTSLPVELQTLRNVSNVHPDRRLYQHLVSCSTAITCLLDI